MYKIELRSPVPLLKKLELSHSRHGSPLILKIISCK
jgi:hypothetical protein